MRAVILESAGAAPRLRDASLPDPEPGPGEAVLRVEACGFSHHDALIMEGTLRRGVTLPRVLGHEVAGTVCAVGEGVSTALLGARAVVLPGDIGHRRDGGFAEMLAVPALLGARAVVLPGDIGGFAEMLAVPAEALVALPAGVAAAADALSASPIGVALKAVEACRLAPGDTLIVTGVSGGVGAHAAQAGYALGASVIGITSSEEKKALLEQWPWLTATLMGDEPWEEIVAAMTDDLGADAALDTIGSSLGQLIACLRHGGRLTLAGQVSANPAQFAPAEVIFRELTIRGSLGVDREHVECAIGLVGTGLVTPIVHAELPLSADALMDAYGKVKRRETVGRLVVRP